MQFSDFSLDKRLLQSLKHLGIDSPTEVQAAAIPVALSGRDLMASSKTGSGKTLAFLLPALQRIISTRPLSKQDPRVLVLLPTRELANQVYSQLRLLVANTQYRAVSILGGENFNDQAKALARNPHFIVATPGRLADHLQQRHLFLNGLELLILDEADRMLDLGFAAQLLAIHQAADHRRRQTLMFSATLAHHDVNALATELLRTPQHVAIGSSRETHQDIRQRIFLSDHLDHKQALLLALLKQDSHKQVIVFTATREDTDRLATLLNQAGFDAVALSGELLQNQRNHIMDQFSRGQQQILVTTDVASRGLDLVNVSLVINFDLPKLAEEYVHRIGRTGRAGAKGDAVSLVGPKDWPAYTRIQAFLAQAPETAVIAGLEPTFKGLAPLKAARKGSTSKSEQPARRRASHQPKQPQQRDKRFLTAVDAGEAPLRRKVASPAPVLDNEPTESEE